MQQMRFEWLEETEAGEPLEVELDVETTEAVIVLMAQALIAVVRAAEEAPDER